MPSPAPPVQATKDEAVLDRDHLGPRLEDLLRAYAASVGSAGSGVPAELLQSATQIPQSHAPISHKGPTDSVAGEDGTDAPEDGGSPPEDGAALIEGGGDEVSPLQVWDSVMKKYGVLEKCEADLSAAGRSGTTQGKAALVADRAVAAAAAVEALARLTNRETRAKLEEFHRQLEGQQRAVPIRHGQETLSNFHPYFWAHCFVDLFFRSDCLERMSGRRPTYIGDREWAKCLLQRADFRGWRMQCEFVARLYNVLLRRSQLRAVHAVVVQRPQLDSADVAALQELTQHDLVAEAMASGECDSVRAVLRRKGLDAKLRRAMKTIELVQRQVRGSEAEKSSLRFRFVAMRVWGGCSSLFFTLNPHDIRSPLTVALINKEHFDVHRFSLDLSDADADKFLADLLATNPRKLHEMAAQDPVATTRCFHYTVRLVLDTLFNCGKPGQPFPDGLPCRCESSVYGHVSGYLGVIEPQMRKALHMHMLVQLHGFAHPADIFEGRCLEVAFRRTWAFVASVCFRSTEAFAHYLGEPSAVATLQQLPLMPVTPKQRGMLGAVRTGAALQAQLSARGMTEMRRVAGESTPVRYFMPTVYRDSSTNASAWASFVTAEVHAHSLRSGNHVCRREVCHKGRLGKQGFCRMLFWHWVQYTRGSDRVCSKRAHGLQLQPRWDGSGRPPVHAAPPFLGSPALEVNHPFHFKLSPSMSLGPRCNHDLGVLLRLPILPPSLELPEHCDVESLIASTMDTIVDHEFYCTNYATKDEPHIEGLLQTLADGVARLEADAAGRRARGEDVPDAVECARRVLHRLMSSTNRRMHKGFPEMLSYILGKPSAYASHSFVTCSYASVFSQIAENPIAGVVLRSGTPFGGWKKVPSVVDYAYRPESLRRFPFYFLVSACEVVGDGVEPALAWCLLHMSPHVCMHLVHKP